MRIVELVNNLEIGGTERLVVDLSVALQRKGHVLTVVCLRGKGPLVRPLEQAGIEVLALDKREGPSPAVVWRLVRHLRQRQIQVVHTHNPLVHHYGLVAGRLAGAGVIINTVHGLGNVAQKPGAKELLYSLTCRFSNGVVAVCPMAYRSFREGGIIPAGKLVAINNGIPVDDFVTVQSRPVDGNFVFGIVGRLVPVKNHQSLLEAFALVVRAKPNVRLEVLGDGPLHTQLQAQAAALGIAEQVQFHGYHSDVPGFLGQIDCAMLCSLSEGLPLSILEAMAAGRPVIGTAVGGMPDLVNEACCGWVCQADRPADLAELMLRMEAASAEERAAMGARARQLAVEQYSLDRMAAEHEQLFERLAR